MPKAHKFWDRIANKYSKQPISDEDAYQHKLNITRDYLRPDMQVLEFGCGTGNTAIRHAPFVSHIHGIDISQKMLAHANDNASAAGVGNVTFEVAGIDSFQRPEQSFDMILAMNILHLLNDKDAVMSRVYKLLKPGGFFISSTTCLGENLKYLKLIAPLAKATGLLPILSFFTPAQLVQSHNDAGFELDQRWQKKRGAAVFIVAKKPAI